MAYNDKISFGHNIRYIQLTLKSSSIKSIAAGSSQKYTGVDFDITSSRLPLPSTGSYITLSTEIYPWILNITYNSSNSATIDAKIYADIHTLFGTSGGNILSDNLANLDKVHGSKIYLFYRFQQITLINNNNLPYNADKLQLNFIRLV